MQSPSALIPIVPIQRDISTVSQETLVDELYMDRRGPLLKAHPMFNFLCEVSPKAQKSC